MREIGDIVFLLLANIIFIAFIASIFWAVRSFFVSRTKESTVDSSYLERRIDLLEQKLDKIIDLLEQGKKKS
ncbi:hypothetical protein [Bacillus sinesaloumensis]|uniref:hypothetical protein n=1 Tax=Litchfieldia sinesaloumensis TaxID=1926280 RepID=UPI00098864F8|nr:hypothetical protein [Bacillus sinesaloumensis]